MKRKKNLDFKLRISKNYSYFCIRKHNVCLRFLTNDQIDLARQSHIRLE